MRPTSPFLLCLLVLAVGIAPFNGAHPNAAKKRAPCCGEGGTGAGCGGTSKPMPCCEIRPAPSTDADLPPVAVRGEASSPAALSLAIPAHMTVFRATGSVSPHPIDLASLSGPPRLYRLHSAYLI